MATCRDEVLAVASELSRETDGTFTLAEIVNEMHRRGTSYEESTIRTHVASVMCSDAPVNHGTTYRDLERLDRGRYRLMGHGVASTDNARESTDDEPVTEEVVPEVPAGNSDVQREAEAVALSAIAARLEIKLRPERLTLSSGAYVDVDGVSHEPPVLVEVWAHQGPPKSAQRNKVLSDALKLKYVADLLDGDYRKFLCFSDDAAASPFRGRSWYAGALAHAGIEIEVVTLSDEWKQRIREAQVRQFR